MTCSRVRDECFEDVGVVCDVERVLKSESYGKGRKMWSDDGILADDPVAVQDPDYLAESLEDT